MLNSRYRSPLTDPGPGYSTPDKVLPGSALADAQRLVVHLQRGLTARLQPWWTECETLIEQHVR